MELGWQPVAKQKNFNILILSISTCFWSFLHFLLLWPGKGGNIVVAVITPGLKDEKLSSFLSLLSPCSSSLCFQVPHYLTASLTKVCCSWLRSPKGIILSTSLQVWLQWDDWLAPFHSKRGERWSSPNFNSAFHVLLLTYSSFCDMGHVRAISCWGLLVGKAKISYL